MNPKTDALNSEKTPPRNQLGRLKNGNRPGDLSAVARCGAKTRSSSACRCPAMKNGRCRLHGGLSTGPRTSAGLERSRKARWKHGCCSREVKARMSENRRRWQELVELLTTVK
jgi:hypothetical protein